MNSKTKPGKTRLAKDIDQWHMETDVAIVGYGGAGASAAIEAHDAGANVCIFELASDFGGSTRLSGADIYLGGSGGTAIQRDCGYQDSSDDMFNYLLASNGEQASEAKIRDYVDNSVDHFDWLLKCGVPYKGNELKERTVMPLGDDCLIFSGSEKAYPFNSHFNPVPRGHNPEAMGHEGGELLMSTLAKNVEQRQIPVTFEARVLTLIIDEHDQVCGLVVRIDQQERNVKVHNGVVLCCGGFCMNETMVRRYAPDLLKCTEPLGNPGDMGSGILMGMAAGGAAINMHEGMRSLAFYQPASLTYGIFINQAGQRFINEDCYHSRVGDYCLKQPGERIYLVLNVEDYGDYETLNYIEAPIAGTGETIEELEQELELSPGSLASTLEFYNCHASTGDDPLFHKTAEWLKPITPPYVALDCTAGRGARYTYFTLGGLETTVNGEVLTTAGDIIKGLYAAGRTACGVPRRGDGYCSGLSVGDATYSGRMAGRSAAQR